MTATLILPIGPPACGKSTLRHWLLDGGFDPDGIVCPDDYRRILTGDAGNQISNKAVFEVVDMIVATRLGYGLDVYVDATNLSKTSRDSLCNFAYGADASIIMVLFDTPHNECSRRNSHRSRPVPPDAMTRMFANADDITSFTLRREAHDAQVYTPEQFMSYSWAFLAD